MGKITRKPLNEAEQDVIMEKAYYDALDEQYQAEQAAKEAYAKELYIARKTTEIKAKLYDVVKSYYSDFDELAKRLQDDYAGTTPYKQMEEDRLGLCFTLDYMDDLESEINELQEETHGMTDKRKTELLGNFVGWFLDHQTSDEGLFRDLHLEIGMTKEELRDFSVESLDEQFLLAEKEKQPINEENGEIKGSYFADEIREMLNPKDEAVVLEWLEFVRDISDASESNFNKELGDTLRALYYVKNVYDEKTLQTSLRFCTLSNEIVKGAMYFSEGKSQEEVRELANQGLLMGGYVPSVNYGKDGEQNEQDETTDMITTEDIVEQVVYSVNAPKCCEGEHAENMLGMLGANIVDEDIYHDEDDCPKMDMGGIK